MNPAKPPLHHFAVASTNRETILLVNHYASNRLAATLQLSHSYSQCVSFKASTGHYSRASMGKWNSPLRETKEAMSH